MKQGTHDYGLGVGKGWVCDCGAMMSTHEVERGCCVQCFRKLGEPKAPGSYLVEQIKVGDRVKPAAAEFSALVESIEIEPIGDPLHTDVIKLKLSNGAELSQLVGHLVDVVAIGPALVAPESWVVICPDGNRRHLFPFETRSDAHVWADQGHACRAAHLHLIRSAAIASPYQVWAEGRCVEVFAALHLAEAYAALNEAPAVVRDTQA